MKKKKTRSEGSSQKSPSEQRGERETSSYDNYERERQFRQESLAIRSGYVRCGGGYMVRRKKIGGDN